MAFQCNGQSWQTSKNPLTCMDTPWTQFGHRHKKRTCVFTQVLDKYGPPDRIRTYDLCLRRATLYPAELRAVISSLHAPCSLAHGSACGALASACHAPPAGSSPLRCIARAAPADESCASVVSASAQLSYGRVSSHRFPVISSAQSYVGRGTLSSPPSNRFAAMAYT